MTESTKLPFRPLLYYSIGNVPMTAIYGFMGAFLLKFYSDEVHLSPALIGWALCIPGIVDAVIDPFIGHWLDRTKLPQGRRRPFFLIGTIPAAILFFFLVTPPTGSQWLVFAYLTTISVLMVCFLSLMGISHLAMGFELTTDYDERTRIFGYKNLIENLTITTAMLSVPIALNLDGVTLLGHTINRVNCHQIAAGLLGIASIAAALIAFRGTREKPAPTEIPSSSFFEGVNEIFQNSAFRVLLIVFILITVADQVTTAEFLILLEQLHGIKEEDSVPVLVGFLVGGLISVWPWVMLAQRVGKNLTFMIALFCWPWSCAALVMTSLSHLGLSLVTFSMGVFGTGMITILGAIVPDTLEYAQTKSNQRREALYVSIGNVIYQAAKGIGFLIAGQTLFFIGYQKEEIPSPQLIERLRLTFAAVPFLFAFGALIAFNYFPINRRSHQQLVERLALSQHGQ